MSLYCPKCGTKNPEDAKICSSCNQSLSALTDVPPPVAKTSALAIWSLALAIMGLYAPFMYIIVLPSIGRIEIQQWWLIFITPLLLGLNPPFALFFGAAALINGFIGLSKIKKSNGTLRGKGLAAIGISISFLLIAWFLEMSVSHFLGELGMTNRIECRKNLSSLDEVIKMYTQEHQTYPQPKTGKIYL